jgi:plasmid stabilization system protein ParE
VIVEFFPAAEADLIRQFRYYLVNCDAPEVAALFRESVRTSVGMLRLNRGLAWGSSDRSRAFDPGQLLALRKFRSITLVTRPGFG